MGNLLVFLLTLGWMPGNAGSETFNQDYGTCRLQLIGLKCIVTEGNITADAIYFKIDYGDYAEEWPKSRMNMSAGAYMDLREVNSIAIDGSVTFNMWDDDTFDPDDFLGSAMLSCRDAGAGEKVASFTEDGAHYKLYYKVY
ncbi:MAG: hypothetical protein HUU01_13735 [Saprospiraceae bacterium]|nr:hypothetical protein [Saprospiraceae bacterium]